MREVDDVVEAITTLAVRGAPTLGIVGALGTALSVHRHTVDGRVDRAGIERDAARLAASRPTAVNLSVGVRRALRRLNDGADAVLDEALAMLAEDEQINRRAASRAADLLVSRCPRRPLRILTHCNTGSLATAGWGTALGAIAELATRGLVESVMVGETRPLLQGARLTTWELERLAIPYHLCVDSAAASAMADRLVDCVVVGADRVVANGDVANKIGTYALAVAARHHGIPFVVVAPESTIDATLPSGSDIAIEYRGSDEVISVGGVAIAAAGTPVWNPAFDITPAELVNAVVTENRVLLGADLTVLHERLAEAIRTVPDFPEPGVISCDLAPVYAQPQLFESAARHLADSVRGQVDAVVAADAHGFVLGTALASQLGVKLVLARKAGKLPGPVHRTTYIREYGPDELQLATDGLAPGERVCIADDVLATGGTVAAVASLVHRCGASVAAVAVLAELSDLGGRGTLGLHPIHAALTLVGASA